MKGVHANPKRSLANEKNLTNSHRGSGKCKSSSVQHSRTVTVFQNILNLSREKRANFLFIFTPLIIRKSQSGLISIHQTQCDQTVHEEMNNRKEEMEKPTSQNTM